jgi:predicted nucleic-acid-binding protein
MVSVVELYCVLTSCSGLRVFAVGRVDFTDCLIERERAASSAGCTQTMTFDDAAVKHTGMALIN